MISKKLGFVSETFKDIILLNSNSTHIFEFQDYIVERLLCT